MKLEENRADRFRDRWAPILFWDETRAALCRGRTKTVSGPLIIPSDTARTKPGQDPKQGMRAFSEISEKHILMRHSVSSLASFNGTVENRTKCCSPKCQHAKPVDRLQSVFPALSTPIPLALSMFENNHPQAAISLSFRGRLDGRGAGVRKSRGHEKAVVDDVGRGCSGAGGGGLGGYGPGC